MHANKTFRPREVVTSVRSGLPTTISFDVNTHTLEQDVPTAKIAEIFGKWSFYELSDRCQSHKHSNEM